MSSELCFNLRLDSGAWLKLLVFSMQEQTWVFTYRYRKFNPENDRQVDVVNDYRLVVPYLNTTLNFTQPERLEPNRVTLSMNVILPQRLGQVYYVGVDISPGAKTFIQFHYEPVSEPVIEDKSQPPLGGQVLRLVEMEVGATKRIRLNEQKPALMKPIDFPFQVLDRLVPRFGVYYVPFLDEDGKEQHFEFPARIKANHD